MKHAVLRKLYIYIYIYIYIMLYTSFPLVHCLIQLIALLVYEWVDLLYLFEIRHEIGIMNWPKTNYFPLVPLYSYVV
jgi:hypothetical protein